MAPVGGSGLSGKLQVLAAAPAFVRSMRREIARADALYIRTPASVAVAALGALALTHNKPAIRWTKYAGEWRGWGNEPVSYRAQRAWLRAGLCGGFVTVNGDVSGEPQHVVSMPNPSFHSVSWRTADLRTRNKAIGLPLRLAFAGRLAASKGPLFAVQVCQALRAQGVSAVLDIAGDGPERAVLAAYIEQHNLQDRVRLRGWLGPVDLDEIWSEAHFALLPTATEGWPKVLSEAMAHRAVPVASPVGAIPHTLRAGNGLVLPVKQPSDWAAAIARLTRAHGEWRELADRAQEDSAQFSYESYVAKLRPLWKQTQCRQLAQ
jgi:glycosyltransferase involved in cell wall biosynthesis